MRIVQTFFCFSPSRTFSYVGLKCIQKSKFLIQSPDSLQQNNSSRSSEFIEIQLPQEFHVTLTQPSDKVSASAVVAAAEVQISETHFIA